MEQHEIDLIKQHSAQDNELKALWDQHQEFERQLTELEGKAALTDVEENALRALKKKKLAGKTRLHQLLDQYK